VNGWNVKQTAALAAVTIALLAGLVVERVRQGASRPVAEFALQRGAAATSSIPATAPSSPGQPAGPEAAGAPSRLVVHVAGAVHRPGVVELPPGARAIDAVRAAGGVLPDADTDAVNLAAKVEDGEQLLLPRKGQSPPSPAIVGGRRDQAPPNAPHGRGEVSAGERPQKLTHPGEGTVNINTASEAELQRLPGVGPAMASRILAFRREYGRFAAPEQLMDVSGIGERTFERMKPFVRVR